MLFRSILSMDESTAIHPSTLPPARTEKPERTDGVLVLMHRVEVTMEDGIATVRVTDDPSSRPVHVVPTRTCPMPHDTLCMVYGPALPDAAWEWVNDTSSRDDTLSGDGGHVMQWVTVNTRVHACYRFHDDHCSVSSVHIRA